MTDNQDIIQLEHRIKLPDALRILVEKYPRESWEGHTNFGQMVQFWLQRHVMFRRLIAMMQEDMTALEAKNLDPNQYRHRFAKLGNTFVGELHMHHNVEDQHYFPRLQKLETSLIRGFEILDADHHAIDAHLENFTGQANSTLKASDEDLIEGANKLHDQLLSVEGFLNRHLTDEEELVVPIVLKHAFDQ